ncbi:GNAT family N-acetyltransferase [Ornithinimicrobium murale]|uniref:GNAT family N-acetyltransferase n=1 Tax=Ornithinimicrobium murale TaxID=1050153 RepID=UPI000E0D3AC9|nr:GNAT family N-acetyltransferase [Ornithinimicrobium murale]
MTMTLRTPEVDELDDLLGTLAAWQFDGAPFQLHPGDVGWFWRHGAEATAAALRTWSRDDQVLAIGLLDEPDLLRLAIDPDLHSDAELARQVITDIADPDRGVLGPGTVDLEIARGVHLHEVLDQAGWSRVDPWPVMRHDLSSVEEHGLRIEVIKDDRAHVWAHVHGAAWGGSPSDEEAILGRWRQLASGPAFADARCLVGFDQEDRPVGTVTVWSAGPGRHGIIEPMGVSPDHRGQGHGRALNLAAASALRELGSSAAFVATPGSNVGAVATYHAAGFTTLYERLDRERES